ncbi:hypothetical protein [Chelativorans intermedius]|uniref:Uncharacterized protein n=1 Tax=Chelativorans intermedius TaxID=515947 RepID=A0ABV6DBL9_9HYPH|nr:hypothetical protein [Chelativorans intermedius]MCT9000460.1 hypothetical protein [Chelativorans intermedius]
MKLPIGSSKSSRRSPRRFCLPSKVFHVLLGCRAEGGTLSEGLQEEAALADLCAEKVVRAADAAINDPTVNLDAVAKAEAAMMAGLKLAALSAFAIGVKAAELVEELECELANLKQGTRDHPMFSMHRKLHS